MSRVMSIPLGSWSPKCRMMGFCLPHKIRFSLLPATHISLWLV